jgi:hypothetical protein
VSSFWSREEEGRVCRGGGDELVFLQQQKRELLNNNLHTFKRAFLVVDFAFSFVAPFFVAFLLDFFAGAIVSFFLKIKKSQVI